MDPDARGRGAGAPPRRAGARRRRRRRGRDHGAPLGHARAPSSTARSAARRSATRIARLTFPLSSLADQPPQRLPRRVRPERLRRGRAAVGIDGAGVYPGRGRRRRRRRRRTTARSSRGWSSSTRATAGRSQPLRVSWIWQLDTGPLERARRRGRRRRSSTRCGRAGGSIASRRCSPAPAASRSRSASGPRRSRAGSTQAAHATRRSAPGVATGPARGRGAIDPTAPRAVRADRRARRSKPKASARICPRSTSRGRTRSSARPARSPIRAPRSSIPSTRRPSTGSRRCSSGASSCATLRSCPSPNRSPRRNRSCSRPATGIAAPAVATDSGLEQLLDEHGPAGAARAARARRARRDRLRSAVASRAASCSRRPTNWSPDVATITLLLHDLADDPLVKPVTLDTLFAEVAPAEHATASRSSAGSRRSRRPDRCRSRRASTSTAARDARRVRGDGRRARIRRSRPASSALLLSLSTANTRAEALAYLQHASRPSSTR